MLHQSKIVASGHNISTILAAYSVIIYKDLQIREYFRIILRLIYDCALRIPRKECFRVHLKFFERSQILQIGIRKVGK